jgi:hypothetical protein
VRGGSIVSYLKLWGKAWVERTQLYHTEIFGVSTYSSLVKKKQEEKKGKTSITKD